MCHKSYLEFCISAVTLYLFRKILYFHVTDLWITFWAECHVMGYKDVSTLHVRGAAQPWGLNFSWRADFSDSHKKRAS